MLDSATMTIMFAVLAFASAANGQVSMGVANQFSVPIRVFWISHTGKEVMSLAQVDSFSHNWLYSYPGHSFVAKFLDSDDVIAEFTMTSYESIWVVRDPSVAYNGCKLFDNPSDEEYANCLLDIQTVDPSPAVARRRAHNTESRETANIEQPRIVPEFTATGFKKIKASPEIMKIAREYYANNKDNIARELWTDDNTVVNFWETPTYMMYLPEIGSMKPAIYEYTRTTLEEWIGGDIPLEPTSMYGIRMYLNNSVLENHVDRLKTHAVSTIINLDQDLDEPWPLHIFDHAGNLHEIIMEPGDMVLYESARAVHGRPVPMQGKYYSNFFTHFAPVDKNLWHFKSNSWRQNYRQ